MHPPFSWTSELEDFARATALAAGFHLASVADVEFVPGGAASLDGERFAAWVEAGRAGEMEYLKRRDASGALLRTDLRVAMPWARSVILCALNYNSGGPGSLDPASPTSGWIGRYAWSGRSASPNSPTSAEIDNQLSVPAASPELLPSDYHDELLTRLRLVEARLQEKVSCETRCYVDTGPLVERAFAARAGIGWIGKNTCVINQRLGSWLLLGAIVTSLPISEAETAGGGLVLAPDRCGSCTRCIDACPTDALVAPREMDASRCIAYLTIEKKGSITEELRAGMGRQVFGCDICQDVCPWNRRSPLAVTVGMLPRLELANPSLASLAELDNAAFKRLFKGSPLERTGRKRLQRNVAIAMGNSGETEFLPRLEAWSAGDDPVLAEAARWAIERLRAATVPVAIAAPGCEPAKGAVDPC